MSRDRLDMATVVLSLAFLEPILKGYDKMNILLRNMRGFIGGCIITGLFIILLNFGVPRVLDAFQAPNQETADMLTGLNNNDLIIIREIKKFHPEAFPKIQINTTEEVSDNGE